MEGRKNILLFVYIPTHFREMIHVARLLKQTEEYNPILLFRAAYANWENDVEICFQEKIDTLGPDYSPVLLGEVNKQQTCAVEKNTEKKLPINFKKILVICYANLHKIKHKLIGYLFKFLKYLIFFLSSTLVTPLEKHPHLLKRITGSIFKSVHSVYSKLWKKKSKFLPSFTKEIRRQFSLIAKVIDENAIKLIILPEDNIFYLTHIFVHLAKKKGIASIIIPFTIANTQEWAEAFYTVPSAHVNNIINLMFATAYPQWTIEYKNSKLILPLEYILATEYLKITAPNPWLINSGYTDAIAVESDYMKKYYQAAGIEEDKLIVTGALYDDVIAQVFQSQEMYRHKLIQELALDDQKPIILCALPPDQFSTNRPVSDFANYNDLIKFWLATMSEVSKDYNIVVNLHPRINLNNISFIKDYPVKVCQWNIAQLVPLAKIYIASCSATIRMAIACGIPVLNYDSYHYGYDDYIEAQGVITCFAKQTFTEQLNKLSYDEYYYAQVAQTQQQIMKQWGCLDGCSGKRMLALINQFCL